MSRKEFSADVIMRDLRERQVCNIPGIGKLKVKDRPERQGRNPFSGEPMTIPASRTVTFTTAKALKEALNPPKG